MSAADTRLRRAREAAARSARLQAALSALPWLLLAAAVAWRVNAAAWSILVLAAIALVALWHAWQVGRAFDERWLARTLNARRRDMEDSADLLFPHRPATNPLEHLQQQRLRQRVQDGPQIDLRAEWRHRRLLLWGALAAALAGAVVFYPEPQQDASTASTPGPERASPDRPAQLTGVSIDIQPPAYTGVAATNIDTLAATVPEGSVLQWTLRFAPMPRQVELVFHDGERLALEREGDAWVGRRRIDRPAVYHLQLEHPLPAAQAGENRIDVILDKPPELRVLKPLQTLTMAASGQSQWALEFEASDDYGLSPSAELSITRTVGSGENITTRQQTITLRGRGGPKQMRYAHQIALAPLGMVAGEDLIVRLSVSDRRTPSPHTVVSPSYILRWPAPPVVESADLDGQVKRVMPAYFRSQRQIIIDAEALLKEKPRLAADRYLERSDRIGVDQRLLRLRYGQFLGEETGGTPQLLPANDAQDVHQTDLPIEVASEAPAPAPAPDPAHVAEDADGHDHAGGIQRQPTFGEEAAVLEQFGHTHDHAEAATLLDPATRELLRSALNEMWQSELKLRQSEPDRALPFAHRALELIKQVQEAERIYLPRVGSQVPPIDPGRRLSGDRSGIVSRRDPLHPATAPDPTAVDAWRALSPTPGAAGPDLDLDLDLDELARWVDSQDVADADPLQLAAAIAEVRRDPACRKCRARLRGALWPLVTRPPAAASERSAAGESGDAYLDALQREGRQ
ncbi:hypothetical protein [Novilysobacter avium]|uniref:DUF4175 domain-containing protein n=1 Tax=Novilysobacter avium TaxID=2781023 RepID=A0A7S6ZV72_9GAMM|nr:hypothetical protein [Lysobacter avium]QOW22907.1 hypothetical protein INQ42_04895 [Lysobacter avium]